MRRKSARKATTLRKDPRPKRQRPRASKRTVFLNVPYDRNYESLYLAFIAGLCGFGLIPRATVELTGSERRLDRIIRLIRRCRYSFHDLSRVQVDRTTPSTPRFNMPFELGLAVACVKNQRRTHEWFVFEAAPSPKEVPQRFGRNRSPHSRWQSARCAYCLNERSVENQKSSHA